MSQNLRIWDSLCKTDPKHTKAFTRRGGFSGTAIKPIYCIERMTEHFGPCGEGWGMNEPQFQLVSGANGEVMVYCTISIWWRISTTEVGTVYGVGGDKVFTYSVKHSLLSSDDEAFKKAYTDAIGNAMKHLGMSADIHMGMFDDSKYLNELKDEFGAAEKEAQREADAKALAARQAAWVDEKIVGLERVLDEAMLDKGVAKYAADVAGLPVALKARYDRAVSEARERIASHKVAAE